MRVVRHEADEEKDQFKVVLKGEAELVAGSLIEIEVRLKGKTEELLEKYMRNPQFSFSLEPAK